MLDLLGTLIANPIWDVAFKIVGVAGLIVAVFAWKAARASVQATKASNITSLKMKAMESMSAAEQSFVSLQSTCRSVSASWKEHIAKHYSPISFSWNQPDELKSNISVEREGTHLLQTLVQNHETLDGLDQDALERFIKEAQRTAVDIERLSFRLEGPPVLHH